MSIARITEEDLKQYELLNNLLSGKARWDLTTAESVQLYRSLIWFAGLRDKLKDNIFQIGDVMEYKAEPEKKKRAK